MSKANHRVADFLFNGRKWVLGCFICLTLIFAAAASQLRVDAGFEKNVPLQHEYMKVYQKYASEFGSASKLFIAITAKEGDIFSADFFETLRQATDAVFFVPGVDRSSVTSLFTPNTRYVEVVEGGFEGGPVVPADFQGTASDLETVRENISKAGIEGRLVANNFNSALITASLFETNPDTGEKLDYIDVASQLEQQLRQKFSSDSISVQIIGFAAMIGQVSDGAKDVVLYFLIAIAITIIFVYLYSGSKRLTALPICCSLIAVIWQLGLLSLLGYGIDPFSILLPFLVFAIAVSHGIQVVNGFATGLKLKQPPFEAAKGALRRLILPGGIALLSDTIGFLTLHTIEIDIIRELAVTASIGVGVIIFTNLLLLPITLSYCRQCEHFTHWLKKRQAFEEKVWNKVSVFSRRKYALPSIISAMVVVSVCYIVGSQQKVGDLDRGTPSLRDSAQYNQDSFFISDNYKVGTDLLKVIVEAPKEACMQHSYMQQVDQFHWFVRQLAGVQSVYSLPQVAKVINSAYNEGHPKWRNLPRHPQVLNQAVGRIPTSSGLLNSDCSVMPVFVFLNDHKATTVDRVIRQIKSYADEHPGELRFQLASGPVGVIAATNEAVQEAQTPMIILVFGAVTLLCWISFRSLAATLCIVLPLAVVSLMAKALMVQLNIGLTVATLPVIALGVGIGVDYGIYIFAKLKGFLEKGQGFTTAFVNTLRASGSAVIFTGVTLAAGVSTWSFSALKFQADMGILLTFMFIVNMLAAITLLPAFAAFLFRFCIGRKASRQ